MYYLKQEYEEWTWEAELEDVRGEEELQDMNKMNEMIVVRVTMN